MSEPVSPPWDDHGRSVLHTYRSIRLATVVLVVLLAGSVVVEATMAGCWQTSISAYYWTPAHGVFIGVLCAVGACLVVYKGSSELEDLALNFSGFLAFVVAMVPPVRRPSCGGSSLPAEYVVTESIRNNVLAVLVAGAAAQAVTVVLARRAGPVPPSRPVVRIARVGGWAVIVLGAAAFVLFPSEFDSYGHDVAAVTMFVVIIGVVVTNAVSARTAGLSSRYARAYAAVAVAMVVTLAAVVLGQLLMPDWGHAVLVVEALLVAEFATFWGFQTAELWGVVNRGELVARQRARMPAARPEHPRQPQGSVTSADVPRGPARE